VKTLIDAPVAQIALNKDNPRDAVHKENGSLDRLAQSMDGFGLRIPIIIRPNLKKKDHFILIAGERRLLAAKRLKWTVIPAILDENAFDKDAFETTMLENAERRALSVVEEISAVATLLNKYDGDTAVIADKMGMTEHQVKLRANAVNLSAKWKAKIAKDEQYQRLSAEHVDLIARLPENVQNDFLSETEDRNVLWNYEGQLRKISDVEKWLNTTYLRVLSKAQWDLDTKIGSLAACTGCTSRSDYAGQIELWDVETTKKKKAVAKCLDGLCWFRKVLTTLKAGYKTALKEHKGLRPMWTGGCSWHEEQEIRKHLDLGTGVLGYYKNQTPCKKSDTNAKPAFILEGPKAGKVVFYLPKSSGAKETGTSASKGKNTVKTMKQRRNELKGLRLKLVYKILRDVIKNTVEPVDTSLESAAALAVSYGFANSYSITPKPEHDIYSLNDLCNAKRLHRGDQVEFCEGWGDGAEKYTADLAGALWLATRERIAASIPHQAPGLTCLEYLPYCQEVGRLVKFDWDAAWKAAVEEKPEPKSWGKLKEDGTPK
jgi:ParB/RepB/Spo0J family partition protein